MTSEEILQDERVRAKIDFIPIISEECESVLRVLTSAIRPSRILELGTAHGYSAAVMALGSDAVVDTVEKNKVRIGKAKALWERLGVADRISAVAGDAAQEAYRLAGEHDYGLVLIDASKSDCRAQFDAAASALEVGGAIVVDDVDYMGLVVRGGAVIHKHRTIVEAMRKFLAFLADSEEYVTRLYCGGNGFAVISLRTEGESGGVIVCGNESFAEKSSSKDEKALGCDG